MTDTRIRALTVAVPTFDRSGLLAETLSSIRDACGRAAEPIDVLVVDNASPDDTRDVVARFAPSIPGLRYERQDANVGGEANFYTCVERAHGTHVWIVGDDDVVEPEAVAAILRELRAGAGAVVVNYSVWSSDMQVCLKRNFLRVQGDRVFQSSDDALAAFGGTLGFTASVVLNRARAVAAGRDAFLRSARVGLSFLDTAYRNMAGVRVAYLAAPLVKNRGNNSRDLESESQGWSADSWNRAFISGIQQVLRELTDAGYSPRAIRRARDLSIRIYVPERLRLLRRSRQSCTATVRCLLRASGDLPSVWTHAMPMLLVPRAVLRFTPRLRQRLH